MLSPVLVSEKGIQGMLARRSAQSEAHTDLSTRRTLVVAAFVVFWMLGISARLVYLQISQHDKLVDRAHQQQQEAIETSPQRGPVLDRQERELARSIETTSIFLAPDEFDKKTEAQTLGEIDCTANYLSSSLGLDQKDLSNQIIEARRSGRRFLWAARRITPEQASLLESLQLTGLHTRGEPK